MCWVMPPASPDTTSVLRRASSSEVLPWSTWPMTVTTGGRDCMCDASSASPLRPSSTSDSATRLTVWPYSAATSSAVSASITSFAVAMWPFFIRTLMMSTERRAMRLASKLTGTKIFISGGDHDLTDNIIHMVIAKIPDENGQIHDDLSTVNFFMVPKILVGEDGKVGARNAVSTGGIEKKMGIKAQATCVLNFDDAKAWRLGPKPTPPKPGEKRSASAGMAGVVGQLYRARLRGRSQGIAIGEVVYQNGYAYAHERRVGHALTGPK